MMFTGAKIWPLFIAAGSAATAAGVSVWAAYGPYGFTLDSPRIVAAQAEASASAPEPSRLAGAVPALAPERMESAVPVASTSSALPLCAATRYALAYQENRADDVISMTHWMQECLKRVRRGSDDSAGLAAVREQLRRSIVSRTLEGNRLRPEGVEDKYIFAPGTRIELLSSDAREDARGDELACPVRERTWLRVTYPDAAVALRDEAGRPIRSIVVGVDVSPDGCIVKAGILGNVELDRESIALDWGL